MNSPVFVKIDVQGLELAVMKGAEKILNKAELVLLEVSTVEYNQGAPRILGKNTRDERKGICCIRYCKYKKNQFKTYTFSNGRFLLPEGQPDSKCG